MKIKNEILKILTVFLFLFWMFANVNPVTAQNSLQTKSINGKVVDSQGLPLPGVTVLVKGTTTGAVTNIDGDFQLEIQADAQTLVFSFIGMITKEIQVTGETTFNVTMDEDIYGIEEVIVTGYQSEKRADITGAIDVVDTEVLRTTTAANPLVALQGQMPGVYVQTSGRPGAGVSMIIRGLSTLGDNSPLYIIDGMPTKSGAGQLDASNIESIQVLKDAAAASIYGSRASNGVVIIETKKGKTTKLTFESTITSQKYNNRMDVLNTEQRGQAMWRASINDGNDPNIQPVYDYEWHTDADGTPVLDRVIPIEWLSEELGIKGSDTDWWDEISRPNGGLITRNNLSLSTSGNKGGAVFGVTHYKNNGVFIEDSYKQLSTNLNTYYQFLDKKVEIGQNLMLNTSTRYPDHVRGGATDSQPIIPVYTEDGGWGGPYGAGFEDWMQPVMNAHINSWDNTQQNSMIGSAYLKIDFTKDLQFRSTVGIDYANINLTDIQRPFVSGFMHRDVADLTLNKNTRFAWNLSNTLNYKIDYGKHTAGILVGTEITEQQNEWLNTYTQDFAVDERDYYYPDAAAGNQNVTGGATGYSLLSFFGKVNYQFAKKYLFSATLRYDGSSRFGDDNKFGMFPSISAGWRMEEEDFIKNNFDFISILKPRFGYGQVGNQEIANDASLALYESLYGQDYTWHWDESTSYDIQGNDSGTLPSGFRRTKSGNPTLKWETTTEYNGGVDFGLFEQALTGSFDYYSRKSEDILISPPYLGAVGEGGARWYNGATVENKGWEANLTYRKFSEDFNYEIGLNLGHFADRITYLPEDVVKAYPGNVEQTILGHSQRALFGYVTDGLFQTQAEVDAHAEQPGKDLGRIKYVDLNGDGVISALDQSFQGNTLPGLIYGLNFNLSYKNWTMGMFINGESNKNIYNIMKESSDFVFRRAGINYGTRVLDAWNPQNTDSEIPALISSNKNDEYRRSSYFIENGSYLKIRTLELAYTFDKSTVRFVDNLRLFVRGENLATIKHKDYTGSDPENPNNDYGRSTKFTLGVNFSF